MERDVKGQDISMPRVTRGTVPTTVAGFLREGIAFRAVMDFYSAVGAKEGTAQIGGDVGTILAALMSKPSISPTVSSRSVFARGWVTKCGRDAFILCLLRI